MYLFSELCVADSSLKLQSPTQWQKKIEGLTDLSSLRKNHLIFIKDKKYLSQLEENFSDPLLKEMGVIFPKTFWEKIEQEKQKKLEKTLAMVVTVENIELAMSRLSKIFFQAKFNPKDNMVDGRQSGSAEIDSTAWIAQGVFIGERVKIGASVIIHSGCVIMNDCTLDEEVELFPQVTLYPNVFLGKRVRIHSGSTIGADGFGYNFHNGIHHKIWHMGGVKIEEDVEIGACSAVDGGTFSPTIIGPGSKIDNHVQVGHNCKFGRGVIICGHVAIGGSSEVGDFSVFAGKAGMGHGHKLGKGCQVAGGALVNCDWPDGTVLGGHPARPLKEWMKGIAYLRKESLKKA